MSKVKTSASSLGDKICELRKRKGLSQEALGDMIGVSRQAISKWELGEMSPNWDNISQLSKFFDVGLNYFSDGEHAADEKNVAATNTRGRFKLWLTLSVIGGIALIALTVFTVCMGLIIVTSNVGNQVIQTTNAEKWELILLIAACFVLLIAEIVFIVFTVKNYRCKH